MHFKGIIIISNIAMTTLYSTANGSLLLSLVQHLQQVMSDWFVLIIFLCPNFNRC